MATRVSVEFADQAVAKEFFAFLTEVCAGPSRTVWEQDAERGWLWTGLDSVTAVRIEGDL